MGRIDWNTSDDGHTRVYGLFQQDRQHCGDPLCWGDATCIAVFPTRNDAQAFLNLQKWESSVPDRRWEVRTLAFNPQNTTEIYTS